MDGTLQVAARVRSYYDCSQRLQNLSRALHRLNKLHPKTDRFAITNFKLAMATAEQLSTAENGFSLKPDGVVSA